MDPNNFQAVSDLDPSQVPEGFSIADPNNPSASSTQSSSTNGSSPEEQQRLAVLSQALTPEALERLNRIKLVKPENAEVVGKAIVNLAMSGKLSTPMNEAKLIELLERQSNMSKNAQSSQASTSTISIRRKKYNLDSDSDDDNDDDLI